MAYKKGKLKDSDGNVLFPKTSLDNITVGTTASGSTTSIASNGKICPEYLDLQGCVTFASGQETSEMNADATAKAVTPAGLKAWFEHYHMHLKSITVAPANPDVGDMYYDESDGVVYQATAQGTWTNAMTISLNRWTLLEYNAHLFGVAPDSGVLFQLDNVSASTTVSGVARLATAAETTAGASAALAVTPAGLKVELDKKQNALTSSNAGSNISIANGTISNTYALPAATSGTRGGGVVSTTASNGIALAISSGTVSVTAVAGTTAAVGTVRLATAAETTAGASAALAVTPAGLKVELDKKQNALTINTSSGLTWNTGSSTLGLSMTAGTGIDSTRLAGGTITCLLTAVDV